MIKKPLALKKIPAPSVPPQSAPKAGAIRRDEILAAARDLFFAKGYENGSMRDIAQSLHLTQAALYYHFERKDQILFDILEKFTDHVLAMLTASFASNPSGINALCNTIHVHVTLTRDYAKEAKLLIEDRKLLGSKYSRAIEAKEREIYDLYHHNIARLIEEGSLKPVSSVVTTFALLASANNIYQWYKNSGVLTIEQVGDQLIQLLLGGILTKRARARLPRALAVLFL